MDSTPKEDSFLPHEVHPIIFKELSFKGKVQYIWNYKKGPVILITFVCIILFSWIYNRLHNVEYELEIASINEQSSKETDNPYIMDTYPSYAGLKPNSIKFNTYLMDGPNSNNTYNKNLIYTTRISSGEWDVILSDYDTADYLAKLNVMTCNLEEFLPPDVYDAVKEHVTMITDSEGNTHPYGLDLSSSALVKGGKYSYQKPVLSIAAYTQHSDECIRFIRYAFQLT